jgi:two-component system, OmpR family, sensor histidine kinase KdpD
VVRKGSTYGYSRSDPMQDSRMQVSGKLKIYLGYAAGVGKTYQMLADAQELQHQGHDVVIGYFEPHGRADTIAKTEGLETIPRRQVVYRGTAFEEMDTDAILDRHPETCVVDEFPHTNVPGSARTKRWEDVNALLEAGIDVLTTMNIQHLESLNDQVWQISGVRVRETIPDWVVKQADQVVMVDLTPGALVNRLMRGVVYAPEKSKKALENFFQESTLGALRELAMRQTAHESESHHSATRTMQTESKPDTVVSEPQPEPTGRLERILIFVTPDPSSAMVVRRAKRVADYLHADCMAVAIQRTSNGAGGSEDREAIERHLNFARNLHIDARLLEIETADSDPARKLVEFARINSVTQIFLARSRVSGLAGLMRPGLEQRIVWLSRDMQVTIVADRARA